MRISDWSSDVCSSDLRYNHQTVAWDLAEPAPSAPNAEHWLGTDDQARDVVARLIYGFRISVVFGLVLAACSAVIGVAAGAVQGYFGGWTDLLFQRFMEIWSGMPTLYLLIILASVVVPNFWWLLARSEEHTSELQSLMRISY